METTTTRWTVRRQAVGHALYFDGALVAVTDGGPLDLVGIRGNRI